MFERLKEMNWRHIGRVSIWTLIVVAFLATVGFTDRRLEETPCSELNIAVHDSDGLSFVGEEDVQQMVSGKYGPLQGRRMGSINIALLEKIIQNNPFVADAEVFSTVDGKLNIEVVQRTPVVRVINYENESFYIDNQGVFMPLSDKFTARVPVVNGYLFDREAEHTVRLLTEKDDADTSIHASVLEEVYRVAYYLHQHELWNAQIQQIYANRDGDLELIPRVGNHTILLGDGRDLDTKFKKLEVFYREGLSKTGWNKYSTINLKYNNQVVCTKR
jgi:cell division protein FtsQ